MLLQASKKRELDSSGIDVLDGIIKHNIEVLTDENILSRANPNETADRLILGLSRELGTRESLGASTR
jgi:hypothetical protein